VTPADRLARVEAALRPALGHGWESSPADEMADEVLSRLRHEHEMADALAARCGCDAPRSDAPWTPRQWDAALVGYIPGLMLGMGTVAAANVSAIGGALVAGVAMVVAMVVASRAGVVK